jgi:hypothetical protein
VARAPGLSALLLKVKVTVTEMRLDVGTLPETSITVANDVTSGASPLPARIATTTHVPWLVEYKK